MKIRTKAEIIGGFTINGQISFLLNDISITVFSLNGNNYVEATRPATNYQMFFNCGIDVFFQYIYEQEALLLSALKNIESIGSFLFGIQEIKYDERETDWIAESNEDKAIVDRLPKDRWSIEKDKSIFEVSDDRIEQFITLCSTMTDNLFAFEFLRQGLVAFRRGNYYFAFINYFMLLEEAFGKGKFQTKELENNFASSDILHLCVLTAIDLLCRNPLDSLNVEWMQKELIRRQKKWIFPDVVSCIVKFRGDYLHSKKRTKVLEQRDWFFKHMAAFTQAICWAYCCYLVSYEGKKDTEKDVYIAEEIQRLDAYWHLNVSTLSEKAKGK